MELKMGCVKMGVDRAKAPNAAGPAAGTWEGAAKHRGDKRARVNERSDGGPSLQLHRASVECLMHAGGGVRQEWAGA